MIVLDDDAARLDFDRIHAWLASSYWSPGIARDVVEKAAAGSHCLGAYREDGGQVGFARAITDRTTFAWIADVWVDEPARGAGLGRRLVGWFVAHPDYRRMRRIQLRTRDAHGVYAALGFTPLAKPDTHMERLGSASAFPVA